MLRGIHVKPLDLDRPLARDLRRCGIESQLNIGDHPDAGFGDPRLSGGVANLRKLHSVAIGRRAMQLHIRGGIQLRECSAEGALGKSRKLQRVLFTGSTNPNFSVHQCRHGALMG
jgi:hypothetical protein